MMRYYISKKYDYLRDYILSIPRRFENEGKEIYRSRNVIKVFDVPGTTLRLNVKRYHAPRYLNKFVYSYKLLKPKGARAYYYPRRLAERGIPTPEPVAYLEEWHRTVLGYSYFVSVQCEYKHMMYELGNAPEGTYEDLATAFGRFTARLHEKGVLHLDYSPGNILWERTEQGEYRFMLVDINRMRFGKVSMNDGCKNFKRLWGPKRFFVMVVEAYAERRKMDAKQCIEIALAERAKFWARYSRKHPIEFNYEP